jgi:uncharacterized lipoprotein YajG
MQKHPLLLAAAASAAILSLQACDNSPQTVNTYDPQAEALANAAPVELPPAITANQTYRCSDNSLFYVTFFNNNTATLRLGSRDAAATILNATDGAPPFTAEGYSLSGNGDNVRITAPGKNNLGCHV